MPIDMRSSFDFIAGAVRRLDLDSVDRHVHLLLNRRWQLAKALWFADAAAQCQA